MTALIPISGRRNRMPPAGSDYRGQTALPKTAWSERDAIPLRPMRVIALTREMGSCGGEVAAGIARKLGLTIIRSESVARTVAERLGVPEEAVLRYVNGTPSLFDRWRVDTNRLARYTAEEIVSLAQQGNVLIQGWGAATLLRDVPQIISVRVCAPVDHRVRVMMERFGTNDERAVRAEIEQFDAARTRALRTLFDVEREDARLYHLVLNTERLSVAACVKAVCELAEGPRFCDHARTRSALADRLLEAKLGSAFAEKIGSSQAPLGVSVSVAGGKVTLAGTTTSGGLRSKAQSIVEALAGSAMIDNRILSVPSRGRAA
jgi:cytidylate kinase